MTSIPHPRWNELPTEYNLRRDAAVLRGPIEWSLDVTNRCKLRCRHCFNRSGVLDRDELSDQQLLGIVGQIAQQSPLGVCVCGGEPLLRSACVLEMGRILSTKGIAVSMVSNGLLLDGRKAVAIAEAGFKMVQISIDGARAHSHERMRRVSGSFDKAVSAVTALREADVNVGVAFTPTNFNIDEWEELYDMCRDWGVLELRIQPFMPLGTGAVYYDEISPSPDQYRTLVDRYKEMSRVGCLQPRLEWGDPVDHLIRFAQYQTMIPYTMHVASDGSLMPSVYLPVVVGDLTRHSIERYWSAGLGTVWRLRLIRELAFRIRSNRDFAKIRPHPYFDAPVRLDFVDQDAEEMERLTDVVLDFVERQERESTRPAGPWRWRSGNLRLDTTLANIFGPAPSMDARRCEGGEAS